MTVDSSRQVENQTAMSCSGEQDNDPPMTSPKVHGSFILSFHLNVVSLKWLSSIKSYCNKGSPPILHKPIFSDTIIWE